MEKEKKEKNETKYSVEQANELIKENGYTSLHQMKKEHRNVVNWIYNNHKQGELVWPNGRSVEGMGKNRKRHDIWKVMDYLRRYAKEEGITLRQSAYKYGYYFEWNELVREGKTPSEDENC